MGSWISNRNLMLTALVAGLLVAGGVAWLLGASPAPPWIAAIVMMLIVATVETLRALWRRQAGIDLLALLTMAGTLVLAEYLAGAVIAFMFASGRMLEEYAGRRARKALTALLERAPRLAHRLTAAGAEAVPVDAVAVGDHLLVKPGEIVPVDGLLSSSSAQLDEAALTGESVPRLRARGERLASGVVNAGGPLEMQALATAADSTYAGVVRMVEQAQAGEAPFTRMADRYALLFTPLVLLIAALAWAYSGEPVRALAVLVVATPCPLILAAPVAIVAAISRAARRGILIKNGAALEQLARVNVMLFDKTGTLTTGLARLVAIEVRAGVDADELLRLAASLDQVSQHVTAQSLVTEARRRTLALSLPQGAQEHAGEGLRGRVDGREVAVGSLALASFGGEADAWTASVLERMELEGLSGAFVGVDGRLAGVLLLSDQIRLDTPRALRELRRAGVRRTVMLSGDRQEIAEAVATALGVDAVLGERSRPARSRRSRPNAPMALRRWPATASTTPRRWRRRTWESPWARAARRRPRRRGTWCCWSIASTVFPKVSGSRSADGASPCRVSWWEWGFPGWRWGLRR
ncbi:heavy metal translocating P-type ATPase [Alkalilimnicola ehrlichii]|uniref:heavy metal translocating P-type ATPase n=1 Tax=Alkalilimnicola ehrlichii TaxID=351052 RepID=UPI001C6E5B14|nr:heavy metal translocating P-type ATPase [Alkalilimnicola ehrlichii]